jgi:hypothetical protein
MVCVGIAGAVLVSVLRIALAERKGQSTDARRIQAVWLAESGLERAAASLATDPDYAGEVWKVSAGSLGGNHGGQVTIEVKAVPDQPGRRLVSVRADYPDDPRLRVRWSKQLTIQTGPSS